MVGGESEERTRSLLNRPGRVPWHVYMGERYARGAGVSTYLARYVRGGPMGKKTLKVYHQGEVTLSYRRHRQDQRKTDRATLRIEAEDFLSRYLAHVAPPRKRRVRGSALYAGGASKKLNEACSALGQEPLSPPPALSWEGDLEARAPQWLRCAQCASRIRLAEVIKPARGPPQSLHRPFKLIAMDRARDTARSGGLWLRIRSRCKRYANT